MKKIYVVSFTEFDNHHVEHAFNNLNDATAYVTKQLDAIGEDVNGWECDGNVWTMHCPPDNKFVITKVTLD